MTLSAEERLIPVRVKIKRAKKHLTELEALAETYRDSYTNVTVIKKDHKGGTRIGAPEIIRLPVIHFDMLAIAGDVLQNLRSSLDHVVYQLALVVDPNATDKTLRKASFPIGETLEDYESLKSRKIKGIIAPVAIQFIDSLKPYQGGNDALWRLHETNNIDKHRRLISIGAEILCDGDGFEGYFWLKGKNPLFAALDIPKGQNDSKIADPETVSDQQVFKSEALLPALVQITDIVEGYVKQFAVFL